MLTPTQYVREKSADFYELRNVIAQLMYRAGVLFARAQKKGDAGAVKDLRERSYHLQAMYDRHAQAATALRELLGATGLGVLPLVPVVAGGAIALAALMAWLFYWTHQHSRALSYQETLLGMVEEKRLSPEQAALLGRNAPATEPALPGASFGSTLGGAVKWLVIGGAALFVAPKLLSGRGGSQSWR